MLIRKSHALLEYSKQDEKKYWDTLIATYKGDSKTLADLKKKSADLDLQIIRETAKNEQELLQEKQQAEFNFATDQIAAKQAEAQQQYSLGNISKDQLLELERKYAKESFDVALKLAQKKRDLLPIGSAERARAEEAILQATRDFAKQDKAISNQQALDKKASFEKLFAPFENAMDGMVQGVLTGQQTISHAVRNPLATAGLCPRNLYRRA